MNNPAENPARPVSLFTIVFLFVLLAAFLFFVRKVYTPAELTPQQAAAEKMPKEMEWRATAESRQKTLAETREAQAKQASSYGWVDEKAGVVRLPIERAMELTVQQHGKKK